QWVPAALANIGFGLPFSATENLPNTLFSLTNEGDGTAGNFEINNSAATVPALRAHTNGQGAAGHFIYNNPGGQGAALLAEGDGGEMTFYATQEGSGATIIAENYGTGSAGIFSNGNPENTTDALSVYTKSNAGRAAYFSNSDNSSGDVLRVEHQGNGGYALGATTTGGAQGVGYFRIQNPTNAGNALLVETNGVGHAINARTEKDGNALMALALGSGNALYAVNSGTGHAAAIRNITADNPNPALF